MIFSYSTLNQSPLLDKSETVADIGTKIVKEDLANLDWTTEVPIEKLEDLLSLLESNEPVINAKITANMEFTTKQSIKVESGKTLNITLDNEIKTAKEAFVVEDGGVLNLSGKGDIIVDSKSQNAHAVVASGPKAKVVVDGVNISTVANGVEANNYAYGIYLLDDAQLEFKSGKMETAFGACIGTNNTTNGAISINISGGELLSESVAIYLATQSEVNISGNAKVQGICARMGHFNISENAEIIPCKTTEENRCDIGQYFGHSGLLWMGDTFAVLAGTYQDADGNDFVLNVTDNAKITSNLRAAVGIYEVDTKVAQDVTVNVENPSNVTTTQEGYEAIKVYDHEYIQEAAQAKGKTYNAKVQSNVVINA